jgi:ABC-type polysaccharide/polyol phosphate transport system ATPase subunit
MKTSLSSASRPKSHRRDTELACAAPIELDRVALRFVSYHDKQYSIKRAVLNLLLQREEPAALSEFWALRDVSLRIDQGERVGILGHNGAGKSTLLRLMARIYPPTAGSLRVRGVVAPLIEMGAGFHPELSGRDNVFLNGALLGFSRRDMRERLAGIWAFTGLEKFADMPLKYYSSGMYVRLGFAIAMEVEPDILLIDESLGVGDASFQQKAKTRLKRVMEKTKAVVIVSHDMASLRELCTRGVWMDHGRVVDEGPIERIIAEYLDRVRHTS